MNWKNEPLFGNAELVFNVIPARSDLITGKRMATKPNHQNKSPALVLGLRRKQCALWLGRGYPRDRIGDQRLIEA